ncbi:MAG TPA: S9 family peptidase [Cyclobacteriaceae bacterium]|nr:S9 family peptidase [Cyclobacteriaceae bacterium]
MKRHTLFFLALWIFSHSIAQEPARKLTLENIYVKRSLVTRGIRDLQWSDDGKAYFMVEQDMPSGGDELVLYNVKDARRLVLVSAKELIPRGENRALEISGYGWSPAYDKLLIFTNTKRVWRYNTRGDYWIFDMASRSLTRLGRSLESCSLMFAKFSPDGTRVAYVSRNNICVESLADQKILKLTEDGGEHTINGTFDWVYEEELDCRDGFRWSSDGSLIAYWKSDTRNVGKFYMINNVDSIYPEIISVPYPKAGTANPAVKVGFVSSGGGQSKWFDIPGDPANHYLARMEFVPGTNRLMIQQLNRRQNTNKVWIADPVSMTVNNILTESDEAFLDIHDDIWWLDGNKYFTWMSERDGWRHLYRISADGKSVTLLTPGNYDVVEVQYIDEKKGHVYLIATTENYTERFLYRCDMNNPGSPERITAGREGTHEYSFSPDGKYALHEYSTVAIPNVYELVDLQGHKTIRTLEDNSQVGKDFKDLGLNTKEFFRVNTGEVTIDGWMIKPPGFDASKKYPVIFYIYGEPAGSTVTNDWQRGDLWHEYLSQLGYIIMSIDNRGTNVPRGREWRKCIYLKSGIISTEDQVKAAQKISELFPFVDPQRLGIWGWSGGGNSTLNCMFRYPKVFAAGIAVAFVSNLRLYDTIYMERYTGIPGEDDEAYDKGSAINFAGNLKGRLMLIHGTGDDNVHYQNCEMLVNELIRNGKTFEMLAYPMRTHGINEGRGTSLHLRKSMEKFWLENLPAGGRP